jgi:NAD(P)-dependent dehydrogenase (short-subunit alcohol dehydrogenase family)
VQLDLSDDVSIRRAAAQVTALPHIDLVINNAGIFDVAVNKRSPSTGREVLLQTNFFGLVLFTELLLPRLVTYGCSTAPRRIFPRIVNLSSVASTWAKIPAHCTVLSLLRRSVDPSQQMDVNTYGLSKLLVAQYTRFLAVRTRGKGIEVCSVHPGAVLTNIFHTLGPVATLMNWTMPILFKNPQEGALPTLHCVATRSLESGEFYADCANRSDILNRRCFSMKEAEQVFELVKAAVKLSPPSAVAAVDAQSLDPKMKKSD